MRRRFFMTALATSWMPGISARSPFSIAYNEVTGALIPLVQAVYGEMGMQPTFELVPSERAIALTNSAHYDADIGRADSVLKHYPNLLISREPLKQLELYAYVRQRSAVYFSDVNQLKQWTVGVVRGSKLAEDFIEQHQLRYISANSAESFYKMLQAKRFDVALISSTQLSAQSPQINALAERVGGVLVHSYSYHIMHKKHAELMLEFDASLRRMRISGRLAEFQRQLG
ncbi:substrate-binding periplasmic protein [Undibacterium flavidum]|uniref:Transporter substrate-binding domain-containing protein n=1 Tax=Undibacterium flavidum TaxID=2762297 RepID=A0ABR6YDK9_9BURK|nr:transporter substrate-binding domain-containing protein [Undibacterium flavidum]MBC3874643.1 transporter substrate-binding domain-containing protein [Undibacterium flavidum]